MRANAPDDVRVTPVDVVDNVTTALGLAAQGLSATLAPAYISELAKSFGLKMLRVLDPETVRSVCLYRSHSRALSPAAEGFAEHLAAWLPGWPHDAGARPESRPPPARTRRKGSP
jgi:DNA-binding transcriptional LysR family regulator